MTHVPYLDDRAGATREIPLLTGAAPERAHVGAVTMVHRLLRGRYLWVAVLGGLGAIAGALAGYLSQQPLYSCEGQVQVKTPMIVLRETPETRPMSDRQVNTQAAFIYSDRTISAAMNSDEWRKTGRGRTPQVEKKFRDSLHVVANRDNAELIRVSFTDTDASVTRAAVEAVLDAYDKIFVKGARSSDEEVKVKTLDDERKKIDTDIQNLQVQIAGLAAEYSTEDLSVLQEYHITEQIKREKDVMELKRELATRNAKPQAQDQAQGEPTPSQAKPKTSLTNEDIAVLHPPMRTLLEQQAELERYIQEQLQEVTEEHRTIKQARRRLEALLKNIDLEAAKFVEGRVIPNPETSNQARSMGTEQLKTTLSVAEESLADWRERTVRVGNTRIKLDELRRRKAQLLTDMQSIDERRKELRIQTGGRNDGQQVISIWPPNDTPSLPATDKRVRMGVLGFIGGGGFPVALLGLWGLWEHKRRFKYSDEAKERGPSAALLGILPHLPRDLADPEQTAAAAHCVHQMRTLLQIGGEDRKVYAITSSTAGDGKTSLALSLGMSFAASGERTLLIDFDMIGRGLSAALKSRADHGLGTVLEHGTMNGSVVDTAIERLWLLPSGRDDERLVSRLSRSMVRDLIAKARAQYDTIIIDTGPILGSLEANFVSAEADGVVLVVGRGQHRNYVDRAFEQLHALGARVAGMVFNRASHTDFMQSATSTSFRSVRSEPPAPVDPKELTDYEPMARTVALDIRR